jgi:hypothetical protein
MSPALAGMRSPSTRVRTVCGDNAWGVWPFAPDAAKRATKIAAMRFMAVSQDTKVLVAADSIPL